MHFLSSVFADALSTVSSCCSPFTSCLSERRKPRHGISSISTEPQPPRPSYYPGIMSQTDDTINEKPSTATTTTMFSGHHRNRLQSHSRQAALPSYEEHQGRQGRYWETAPLPARPAMETSTKETAPRKSLSSSIRSFSVRKPKRTHSRGRPHISGPTNFRHIHHESVPIHPGLHLQEPRRAPEPVRTRARARSRPESFRPLELSIYQSQQQLSPILPLFSKAQEEAEDKLLPLPPAHTDDAVTLVRQKSYSSSMSFHLPRRGTSDNLSTTSGSENVPSPPPKSKARGRAHTSPSSENMVARIASAMIEKEKLQDQIDEVVERQSIYSSSRPSTGHGMQDFAPMPDIPALPPTEGLTFAERVSTPAPLSLERPRTAPPKSPTPVSFASRSPTEISLPLGPPPRAFTDRALPPPLPLVLRPPLRKKKSFSRVSNWLFPGQQQQAGDNHKRDVSLDSVTNLPRPVKDGEGFYQCVEPATKRRTSFDTVSSVSTWVTDDGEVPSGTAPSNWSPSSPGSSQKTRTNTPITGLQRTATFGGGTFGKSGKRQSVGVAY